MLIFVLNLLTHHFQKHPGTFQSRIIMKLKVSVICKLFASSHMVL